MNNSRIIALVVLLSVSTISVADTGNQGLSAFSEDVASATNYLFGDGTSALISDYTQSLLISVGLKEKPLTQVKKFVQFVSPVTIVVAGTLAKGATKIGRDGLALTITSNPGRTTLAVSAAAVVATAVVGYCAKKYLARAKNKK